MEETKSIDKADMVLRLFLDSMTTNFSNQFVMDKQAVDILKKNNKQKVVASLLPLLLQEQCLLPHQMPAQSDQELKQKQISQKNNDQEGRCPRNDPIPMSYTQLLPILINVGEIMPKRIQPAGFPYLP